MNLPNSLTVARIFLVPVLVSVLLTKFEGRLVLGLAGRTRRRRDFRPRVADRLARRLSRAASRAGDVGRAGARSDRRQAADLGDARSRSCNSTSRRRGWSTVIIGREFAVTGLRSIAYARGLTMPASPLGKLKMVSQVVAILLLILGWERMPLLLLAGQAALWVVLATALVSAVDYYRRFNRAMSQLTKVADFSAAKARAEERKRAV